MTCTFGRTLLAQGAGINLTTSLYSKTRQYGIILLTDEQKLENNILCIKSSYSTLLDFLIISYLVFSKKRSETYFQDNHCSIQMFSITVLHMKNESLYWKIIFINITFCHPPVENCLMSEFV